MKQKISLSVSCFYVTCQFLNVFTFSMHWRENFLNNLKSERISLNVFVSSWRIDIETIIMMRTLSKTVWRSTWELTIACLTINREFLSSKSISLSLRLIMSLRWFSSITTNLTQEKKNAIRLSVVLEGKRLNKRLEYTHVRSKKVENESCIWEAWVSRLCRSLETDFSVIELLRLHLCEYIDVVVRRNTTDVKQFVSISTNQDIRTGSEWWNERTQQLCQNCVVETSTQRFFSFDLGCRCVSWHRCSEDLDISQNYWLSPRDSRRLFTSTLTILHVFLQWAKNLRWTHELREWEKARRLHSAEFRLIQRRVDDWQHWSHEWAARKCSRITDVSRLCKDTLRVAHLRILFRADKRSGTSSRRSISLSWYDTISPFRKFDHQATSKMWYIQLRIYHWRRNFETLWR